MDSEQAFLLEVIVGKVEVQNKKRNEKNVGFEDSWMAVATPSNQTVNRDRGSPAPSASAVSEAVSNISVVSMVSAVTGMPSTQGVPTASNVINNNKVSPGAETAGPPLATSPMKLLVGFTDFPAMEIHEDQTPDSLKERREKAEEAAKIDYGKAQADILTEDRQKAKAAGLTLQEYKDSQRMKAASRISKKFKKGKSHFFRMRPTVLLKLLKRSPLVINALQDLKDQVTTPSLGQTEVPFPESFFDAVKTAAYYALMREMIAREGHIYWPRSYYSKATRMRRREQAKQEALEKQNYKCPETEVDLYHRFKDLLGEPSPPPPCPVCYYLDDPCKPIPQMTFVPDEPTRPPRKKRPVLSRERRRQIQMCEPSPEPIRPPNGAVVAELDDTFQLTNSGGDDVAMINVFVRLSCFGNLLNMELLA